MITGAETRGRVLGAFAAWLNLTPGAGLPGAQLAQHPLTTAALEGLASLESFDQAADAIVELIYSTSTRGEPDQDSLALVSRLVPAVRLIPKVLLKLKFTSTVKFVLLNDAMLDINARKWSVINSE